MASYTSRLVVARLLLRGAICVAFALLCAAYGLFERPERGSDVAFVAILTAAFGIGAFVCFRRARIEQRAVEILELRRRQLERNERDETARRPSQVVGRTCRQCDRKIVVAAEGRTCATCDAPLHDECVKEHARTHASAADTAYRD